MRTHFAFALALLLTITTARLPVQQQDQQSSANPGLSARTNLVLVRVIVRDSKGKPVPGLSQNDFKLYDNKKQQAISYFHADVPLPTAATGAPVPTLAAKPAEATPTAPPQRFAALFFDDYHISFGDLVQIRESARKYLEQNLNSGARVAIFTASGKPELAFTDDAAKIEQALSQLRTNNRFEAMECPKIPAYLAEQASTDVARNTGLTTLPTFMPGTQGAVQQSSDPVQALNSPLNLVKVIAVQQGCAPAGPLEDQEMKDTVENILLQNDLGMQATLSGLARLVQRMAETPGGQRTIGLISDGFFSGSLQYQMDELSEFALRENVVINTLDSRGLYLEAPDLSQRALGPEIEERFEQMKRLSDRHDGDTLSEIAGDTGGLFVQNTNDMNAGVARISALNGASYLLGFTPENLKPDGRFHSLQVKLASVSKLQIQARKGYYAPDHSQTPARQEGEMEQAVFSQENVGGLPIQVSTMSKRIGVGLDALTVTVDADMRSAQFRKEGGRNLADIKLLVVLFDRDGNCVAAKRQTITLRLPDAALDQIRSQGGEASVALSVKPGHYFVRTVLTESGSDLLGAASLDASAP